MFKHLLGIGVLSLGVCSAILTFTTTTRAASSDEAMGGTLSSHDLKFVSEAATGGMTEVKASQLAVDKAINPDVKSFAQKMIDDHTKANLELKTLAEGKGVTMPTDLTSSQQSHIDDLTKLGGDDFDKAYVKMMVKDHQSTVDLFQHYSGVDSSMLHKPADDADLKEWIRKTLPTLQDHLTMIEDIQSKMK